MEKPNPADEVDLVELTLRGVNIVRRNFLLLTTLLLIGIVLGVVHYFTSKKVFTSKMVISSGILTKSFSEKLFDNTRSYLRENNYQAIASQLNVSQKAAQNILFIKIENVTEVVEQKDQERFIVTVEVYDQDVLEELQQGIIYYLSSNEFVKVRVQQNKNSLTQTINKIEKEIAELEDLKIKIYSGEFFRNLSGNLMFDPTTVNSKILELTKEKINLQNNLELVNSVQVIEGFNRFEKPIRPKLSVSIALGATIGLILAGLLILFKAVRRLLVIADAAEQKAS
jgi:hypothetical protein